MKRIGLFLLVFIMFSGSALASGKIAYVELQRVIETSEPGKKALGQLTQRFEDMNSELDRERANVEKMREDLQKQSLVLSQDAQEDLEVELRTKIREIQEMFQAYQARMQREEQELVEPILQVIFDIINEYGKKHEYAAIFDAHDSGIIYANKDLDITDKVIEELNKAWEAKN